MSKRTLGLALILFGMLVSIFSLVADPLGISFQPNIIGWKNLTGAYIGVFMGMVGLWFSQYVKSDK